MGDFLILNFLILNFLILKHRKNIVKILWKYRDSTFDIWHLTFDIWHLTFDILVKRSYLIYLHPLLSENIAHVVSFLFFVFVIWRVILNPIFKFELSQRLNGIALILKIGIFALEYRDILLHLPTLYRPTQHCYNKYLDNMYIVTTVALFLQPINVVKILFAKVLTLSVF